MFFLASRSLRQNCSTGKVATTARNTGKKNKEYVCFFKKKQKQRSDGPERSVQNSWLEMKVEKLYGGLSDERAAGQT